MKTAALVIISIGLMSLVISVMAAVKGRLLSRIKGIRNQKASIEIKMDEIEIKEKTASDDGWETATTLIYDATELLDNGTEML